MAWARCLDVNPANPDQYVILFGDGRVVSYGGAPEVPQSEAITAIDGITLAPEQADTSPTYFFQAPTQPAQKIKVIDWSTPAGYTLDIWGTITAWGGATSPGVTTSFRLYQPSYGYVSDFAVDPADTGKCYILLFNGDIQWFGPGTSAVPHGGFLNDDAKSLVFDWATLQHWIMDSRGFIHPKNGGTALAITASHERDVMAFTGSATRLRIYDMTNHYGFAQCAYGYILEVNGGGSAPGWPDDFPTPLWNDFEVLSDSPTQILAMNVGGGTRRWTASTAPTVTVDYPADPTTTTTRPTVSWTYTDAEGDAQVTWKVKVFSAAQYGAGGFNPDTSTATWSGTGRILVNAVKIPIDLDNATYRAYVQVEDTSHLLSTWAYKQWVQNVTRPVAPTITATPSSNPLNGIALVVTWPGTLPDANIRVGVQYRDADEGSTDWHWVRNGVDLLPGGGGVVNLTDYEARLGIARTYRAFAYYANWIAGIWSSTVSATLTDKSQWLLSNPFSPTADRVVKITPDISFEQPIVSTGFAAAGRDEVIVISDGGPKTPIISAKFYALTNAQRLEVQTLMKAGTLLLRDPFGNGYFARLVGSLKHDLMHAVPLVTETTPIRDARTLEAKMQAIGRPSVQSSTSPELNELVVS